ncbi:hypothetical protein GZL_00161 [Streptomyces sp. 769]|nr:hypothetical protein GZL_00161 [Streptomyces sp. 769]
MTGCTRSELENGARLITEIGAYGPGGRVLYATRPADPHRGDWGGEIPDRLA